MTATCNFGPANKHQMYPWSGCKQWDLPPGAFFSCNPRPECANATRGSREIEDGPSLAAALRPEATPTLNVRLRKCGHAAFHGSTLQAMLRLLEREAYALE